MDLGDNARKQEWERGERPIKGCVIKKGCIINGPDLPERSFQNHPLVEVQLSIIPAPTLLCNG